MCSKESIKGRAAFNNLLCIISRPIVPSGMEGPWVRWPSVSPGQFIARSALGRKRPLFTGNAGQGRGPCSGVCHLSEAQGRRVLFSGMSPFYRCFVFPSGLKRRAGSAVLLAVHPPRVWLTLKRLALQVCAGASKQKQPIHPSTSGTRLVKPHCQAFSGPSSTYAGPGWARGHSLSGSPSSCVLLTPCSSAVVLWAPLGAVVEAGRVLSLKLFRTQQEPYAPDQNSSSPLLYPAPWQSKKEQNPNVNICGTRKNPFLALTGKQFMPQCEMWLSLCYLALSGFVCY